MNRSYSLPSTTFFQKHSNSSARQAHQWIIGVVDRIQVLKQQSRPQALRLERAASLPQSDVAGAWH